MQYKDLILEKKDGIAILTLNRPQRLNALGVTLLDEFPAAIKEVDQDEEVRVLILTGAGEGFCSGADVKDILATPFKRGKSSFEDYIRASAETLVPLLNLMKPTIAAINGMASGGGLALALMCDIRIASEKARFTTVFIRRALPGLTDIMSTLLPRIVGLARTLELAYTGDIISAQEADRIGLVNRVVPHKDLMKATGDLAAKLAEGPPIALALTKFLA
jgi:2-(1,2-epoxy-1,2-dihydrophenyl)acetyl-CoA isomerase